MGEILVVEDDRDIQELIQYHLERQGFRVITASDGEEALALSLKHMPRLVLLDLMLPSVDGLTVCRRLKENPKTNGISVVMLTAKGEESDIVIGLELGADDYVTKPFSPKEMVARVRAVLRRSQSPNKVMVSRRQIGPVEIDKDRHEVHHRGKKVKLTLAEFRLLDTLTSRPGRVFTRDQLLESITDGEAFVVDRNVDVHVRAIRKKLESDSTFIETVRGVGYKCQEVQAPTAFQ